MFKPIRSAVFACAAAVLVANGCARSNRPQALEPGAFSQSQTRIPTEPGSAVDQPGPLIVEGGTVMVDVANIQATREQRRQARDAAQVGPDDVSAPVTQAVRPPSEPQLPPGTTAPTGARRFPGASSGSYLTIGGVVAEVNGEPVYANDVLAAIEPVLAARAKDMDERQFRAFAAQQIADKIRDYIKTHLEYAAAQKYLNDQEKQVAQFMTERWRDNEVAAAGGSEELARRRYTEQGIDFDERVKEQHRTHMSQLFYQKRVVPRIRVSATDLREYYQRNKDREFTVHDRAKFRLIKIEPQKVSGDAKVAAERIADLRKRALAGEDFGKLAEFSTDPVLARGGGQLPTASGDGFFEKGTFAVEKVEDAVWQLQPGEVSDVIDAGNAFYLARLEQKEQGRVKPFEAEETQDAIRAKLTAEQFNKMRGDIQTTLMNESLVRGDPAREPQMMQTALEIAMQRYPAWREG